MFNFHLPLPQDLHEMLKEEVERSGQPATSLAREALVHWLAQRRKQHLHEEIAAFVKDQGGTELDLDEELEQAGIDSLLAERAR
jgi:hypothetical protein